MRKGSVRVALISMVALAATAGLLASACSSSNAGDDDNGTTPDATVNDSGKATGSDAGRAEPSIKLAAGGYMTCALQAGVVKCWGDNSDGQLGIGPTSSGEPPAVVSGIPFSPTMIATSGFHTCASDGTHTSCWGENGSSELGSMDAGCGSNVCISPISADSFGPLRALALGDAFTCFIAGSGAVNCLGYSNGYGTLGPESDGGVQSSALLVGLTNSTELGAGGLVCRAHLSDGTVSCWGDDLYGELGQVNADGGPWDDLPHANPLAVPGVATVRQLSVSPYSSCAVLNDNTVTCWGFNGGGSPLSLAGELGHDPATDPPCAGNYICNVAMPIAGLTNVREVTAGYYAGCAVKMDDTVVCWGSNRDGELNAAPTTDGGEGEIYNFVPQVMPGLANVAHVVWGYKHACAVTWDDHVLCWGDNSEGELGVPSGDGGINQSPSPVTPQGF